MRWRIGAVLALASSLVVGYWEATVPHPGAEPRVVARVAAGTAAALGPIDATLISLVRGSSGPEGAAVPAGGVLLVATVDLSAPRGGSPVPSACELRVAAPGRRSWLPLALTQPCGASSPVVPPTSNRHTAWFVVPPDVALAGLVVEVRTVGAEPQAVQLLPAAFS